ncbi:unnamed protein product [Candidula unifasciata]|uniref:SH3 domain-binding glutamic acid-rich-like protein n=1 Tax=Candidula unifasciata TaxID=100452 RepID=A0A8S3ZG94_9EUPU|nr:unnamed protein product [Candidula unifasciata]
MSGKITVFISSVTSSMEVRKHQMKIQDVLSGAKIDHEVVDVSANKEDLSRMRDIVGDSHALAPQIVNGDNYCGNYEAFDEAVENKTLKEFLKL